MSYFPIVTYLRLQFRKLLYLKEWMLLALVLVTLLEMVILKEHKNTIHCILRSNILGAWEIDFFIGKKVKSLWIYGFFYFLPYCNDNNHGAELRFFVKKKKKNYLIKVITFITTNSNFLCFCLCLFGFRNMNPLGST